MKVSPAIALVIALLLVSPGVPAGDDSAKELGARYKKAESEDERLRICIEAINSKVICQNCSIRDLDTVFGTDFARLDTSTEGEDGYLHEIVPFNTATIENLTPPQKGDRAKESPSSLGVHGWVLGVRFSRSGRIVDYSITNVSKPF